MTAHSTAFKIVSPDEADDHYAGSDVPGEFRRLTELLGAEQIAVTMIRVPPHSDFEQGTGHYHDRIEEIYLITRGTLTMRFADEIHEVRAPAAVRVAPHTPRSHRNQGAEPVEIWAISRSDGNHDAVKIDDFWQASTNASQHRG
jgi:mannose-6-phosphate isomerase-like protein (cupin superfamily)